MAVIGKAKRNQVCLRVNTSTILVKLSYKHEDKKSSQKKRLIMSKSNNFSTDRGVKRNGAIDHKHVAPVARINKYFANPDLRTVNNNKKRKA